MRLKMPSTTLTSNAKKRTWTNAVGQRAGGSHVRRYQKHRSQQRHESPRRLTAITKLVRGPAAPTSIIPR